MSEFVSDNALVLREKSLNEKDFIVKRRFNKIISPFIKVIEKIGWHLICKHKALGFMAVVKEFYANMVEVREKIIYVRGEWISFSREKINETLNQKEQKDGSNFKKLVKKLEYHKIVDLPHRWKRNMEVNKENPI